MPYNTCYEVMGKAHVIPFKNMGSPNESLLTTINKSTNVLGSMSACVVVVVSVTYCCYCYYHNSRKHTLLVKNIFLSGNILICVLIHLKQDTIKKEASVAVQTVRDDTGRYSVTLSHNHSCQLETVALASYPGRFCVFVLQQTNEVAKAFFHFLHVVSRAAVKYPAFSSGQWLQLKVLLYLAW